MTKWSRLPRLRAPGAADHRRTVDTMRELAGHPALYDEPARKVSGPRVQHERDHQAALAIAAQAAWWGTGFRFHPQEADARAERLRSWRGGMVAGWPDVTLILPRHGTVGEHRATLAAVELKQPGVGPRRRGELDASVLEDGWWLEWLRGLPERDPLGTHSPRSRYGLRENQALCLRDLHLAGWCVSVQWGWESAFEWLDQLAGPRPSVMPEGWV